MNLEGLDWDKRCRFCLNTYSMGHLRSLFLPRLNKMIEPCFSINVSIEDGLPSQICNKCTISMVRYYDFRKKVINNDNLLKRNLKTANKKSDILNIAVSKAEIEQINEVLRDEYSIETKPGFKEAAEKILSQQEERTLPTEQKMDVNDISIIQECCDSNLSTDICGNNEIFGAKDEYFEFMNDALSNKGSKPHHESEDGNLESSFGELPSIITITTGKDGSKSNIITQTIELPQEPPPLVPITRTEKLEIPPKSSNSEISLFASNEKPNTSDKTYLSKDTPPLIPIKPNLPCIIEKAPNVILQCCDKTFESVSELKTHKTTDCAQKLLQCNICKKEFEEKKKLVGHLKGHMIRKDYACKICGKRYPNPSTFRVHMRSHTGEKPFKCEVCNKGFTRWAGVVGHMKTHGDCKPYQCDTCGKAFKMSSNLIRHKVLHTGTLPYVCNYCGKAFSQSDNLQLHIRTYHTNERPYLCSECGKGFVSHTRLNRHMWVHSGFKPYKCSVCPKEYSNSNDLKIHERVHHKTEADDRPYACDKCGMKFYQRCRLKTHFKTHLLRPYECNKCGKAFRTCQLLVKHSQKHLYEEEILDPLSIEPKIVNE